MDGLELGHLGGTLGIVEGRQLAEQRPGDRGLAGRRLVIDGDGVGIAHVFDYTPKLDNERENSGRLWDHLGSPPRIVCTDPWTAVSILRDVKTHALPKSTDQDLPSASFA